MSFEDLPKFGMRATQVRPGVAVVGSGNILRVSFTDLRSVGISTELGAQCVVKIGVDDDAGCIALCRPGGTSIEENNQARALTPKASRHSTMYIQCILTHMKYEFDSKRGRYPTQVKDGMLLIDFNDPIGPKQKPWIGNPRKRRSRRTKDT